MPTYKQTFSWRDAKGQTARTVMYITGADLAAAAVVGENIRDALAAVTNAAPGPSLGPFTSEPAVNTYGADLAYPTIEDKAVFVFQSSTGSPHRFSIPAPKTGIFLADDETVDPANGLVTALETAMLAGAASRDGVAITDYVGGFRERRKLQKRFNVFTRNPALTGPGL